MKPILTLLLAAAATLVVPPLYADLVDPQDDVYSGATFLGTPPPSFIDAANDRTLDDTAGDRYDWFQAVLPAGTYSYRFSSDSGAYALMFAYLANALGEPGPLLDSAYVDPFGGELFFTLTSAARVYILIEDYFLLDSELGYTLQHQGTIATGGGGGSTSAFPTITTISAPGKTKASSVTLSGTSSASIDTGSKVVRVQVRHRTRTTSKWSSWKSATGTDSWSFKSSLARGSNFFQIQAIDAKGTKSVIATVMVYRK